MNQNKTNNIFSLQTFKKFNIYIENNKFTLKQHAKKNDETNKIYTWFSKIGMN